MRHRCDSPVTWSPAREVLASTSVSGPGQSRSASLRAYPGICSAHCVQVHRTADVHDQRVIRGPALGGVDPGHRRRVAGVRAETVDRLGGQPDQAALREQLGSLAGIGDQQAAVHGGILAHRRSGIARDLSPPVRPRPPGPARLRPDAGLTPASQCVAA